MKRSVANDSTDSKLVNRLSFIQSKCGICLYEKYRYANSLQDFQWYQVSRIIKYCSNDGNRRGESVLSRELCTICLGEPVLPRMDRCGHMFCLCCLIELLRHNASNLPPVQSLAEVVVALNKVTVLCPFCKDLEIGLLTVKRVTLMRTRPLPKPPQFVSFSLLVKSKGRACPRLARECDTGGPSILPTTGSPLATFVSVTIDIDKFWIGQVENDVSQLQKDRDRSPSPCIDVAMALLREEMVRALASTASNHDRYGDDDSDDGGHMHELARSQAKAPVDRTPLADRFNLLMPLPGNDTEATDPQQQQHPHRLFYQCPDYRGASLLLLDPLVTRTIIEFTARRNYPPPVELRVRLEGALIPQPVDRQFLAQSRLDQLVPGTTVWLARIDWTSLLCTNLTSGHYTRLNRQWIEMLEQQQLTQHRLEQIAQHAAERKHLKRRSSAFCQQPDDALSHVVMKPRPIIAGFNTCTLGIECVAPDDDYPHAETCEHFKLLEINTDDGDQEQEGQNVDIDRPDDNSGVGVDNSYDDDRVATRDCVTGTGDHDDDDSNCCYISPIDVVKGTEVECDYGAVKDSGIETGSSDGSTGDRRPRPSRMASSTTLTAPTPSDTPHNDRTNVAHKVLSPSLPIDTSTPVHPRPSPSSNQHQHNQRPISFLERILRRQQDAPRPPEIVTNPWEMPREDALTRFKAAYVVQPKKGSQRLDKQRRKKGGPPR